jgi:hypothetical protein
LNQHQRRGNAGQLVAPQTKRTANPSPINVDPTSTPLTRSVPQPPRYRYTALQITGVANHREKMGMGCARPLNKSNKKPRANKKKGALINASASRLA